MTRQAILGDWTDDDAFSQQAFEHLAGRAAAIEAHKVANGWNVRQALLFQPREYLRHPVAIERGAGRHEFLIAERSGRTDGSGKIRFKIDQPGRWYVKFINMVKLESDPEIDYESKWATLTFAVR